jgi:hypothetical protein
LEKDSAMVSEKDSAMVLEKDSEKDLVTVKELD